MVTAAVAASTTEVIWELLRELESVLLVLRDDTLEFLELLVEMRLALNSLITVEERVVTVVSVSSSVVSASDVSSSDVVDAPPPLSLLQPITMKNDSSRTEYEKRFEKVSFLTLLYLKINVPILSSFEGFLNGLFSINGCLSYKNCTMIQIKQFVKLNSFYTILIVL